MRKMRLGNHQVSVFKDFFLFTGLFLFMSSCTKLVTSVTGQGNGFTGQGNDLSCSVVDSFGGNYTTNNSENFQFSCSSVSGLAITTECFLNGVSLGSCSQPSQTVSLANSDTYTFHVVGTTSEESVTSNSVVVKTDFDDPVVNSLQASNTDPTNTVLNFSGADQYAGTDKSSGFQKFQCQLVGVDSQFVDCGTNAISSKTYDALTGNTTYTFLVKAIDNVGNETDPAQQLSFTTGQGLAAGSCQIVAPYPTNPSGSTSARLHYTCAPAAGESISAYQCRINAGTWNPCMTSPSGGTPGMHDLSSLPAGTQSFDVRYLDSNGNPSNASTPHTWLVDLSPPVTSITNLLFPSDPDEIQLLFSSTDNSGGSISQRCMLERDDPTTTGVVDYSTLMSWHPCSSPLTYSTGTGREEGVTYRFTVEATDQSGRISTKDKTWTNGKWFIPVPPDTKCGDFKWIERTCTNPAPSVFSNSTLQGWDCQGPRFDWYKHTCTITKDVASVFTPSIEGLYAWNIAGCSPSNLNSLGCRQAMDSYCSSVSYWHTGFGAVSVAGNDVSVACVTTDISEKRSISSSTMSSNSCDPAADASDACMQSSHNYCVSESFLTGFGPIKANGSDYDVACLKADSGSIESVNFSQIMDPSTGNAACSSSSLTSADCRDGMTKYCKSMSADYSLGLGPYNVNTASSTLDVFCVKAQQTVEYTE